MAIKNMANHSQLGMGTNATSFMLTSGLGSYTTVVGTVMRALRRLRARSIAAFRGKVV